MFTEYTPWKVREEIIQKITDNEYYDEYGVSDPMMDLIRDLPQDREEKLKTAEIMWNGSGFMKKDGAKLFRELGEEGRYIQYLETHLGDDPVRYMEVIRYCGAGKGEVQACLQTRLDGCVCLSCPEGI